MTAPVPVADLLQQLEELRAAATPGPWYERAGYLGPAIYSATTSRPGIGHTYMPADAALIVATVNTAPRLTAAVRAALAEAELFDAMAVAEIETRPAVVATRLRTALAAALEASDG